MKTYLSLLFIILLASCSTGLRPLKNSQLKGKSATVLQPIVYTNTVQLIKPSSTNSIEVEVPVIVSKPNTGNINTNILDDIKVTLPQKIYVNIIIPNSTNTVTLSGEVIKEKANWTSPALFLYYFILICAVLIGIYMWKTKKSKSFNLAMKNASAKAITTTVIPPTVAVENPVSEHKVIKPSDKIV